MNRVFNTSSIELFCTELKTLTIPGTESKRRVRSGI